MAARKTSIKAAPQELGVETILKNCIEFLNKFQTNAQAYKNFLVEEAELDEAEQFWKITLGYDKLKTYANPTQLSRILAPYDVFEREYKVFKVHALTGKVISMKIRENAPTF